MIIIYMRSVVQIVSLLAVFLFIQGVTLYSQTLCKPRYQVSESGSDDRGNDRQN